MTEADKEITMKASEAQALIAQVQALTQQVAAMSGGNNDQAVEGGKVRNRPVRHHNVTILFIDEKPVIGMENVGTELNPSKLYEVPDPKNSKENILKANLIVRNLKTGQDEVIKGVNFMELILEGERRECKVLKNRDESWVIEQGVVLKKEVKDYRTVELDVEVPLEISGTERYFMVEIDGKGVEIFEDYVNMAKSTPRPMKQYVGSSI